MEAVYLQTALFKETLFPFFSYHSSILAFIPFIIFSGFLDLPTKVNLMSQQHHLGSGCCHTTLLPAVDILLPSAFLGRPGWRRSVKVKVFPSLPGGVVTESIQEGFLLFLCLLAANFKKKKKETDPLK